MILYWYDLQYVAQILLIIEELIIWINLDIERKPNKNNANKLLCDYYTLNQLIIWIILDI